MTTRRTVPPLNVFMNEHHVGQVFKNSHGALQFTYDPNWIESGYGIPISLSLPLQEKAYGHDQVQPVLDNLLPDCERSRRRIAENVGATGEDTYSILAKLGRDCVGALRFVPEGEELVLPNESRGRSISNSEIGSMLRALSSIPLGVSRESGVRFTLPGRHAKTALVRQDNQWLKPEEGVPTTHIIKGPVDFAAREGSWCARVFAASVEIEFYCLRLLKHFGLPVADAEVMCFDGVKALVVERFDRQWVAPGQCIRVPQEDCCQALSVPPVKRYQVSGGPGMVKILRLLSGSDQAQQDRMNFLAANILFWLLNAVDGHAKNFSLFLLPGERYCMTPIYDVISFPPTSAASYVRAKRPVVPRHSGNRSRHRVQGRLWCDLAMSAGKRKNYWTKRLTWCDFAQTAVAGGMPIAEVKQVFEQIHDSAAEAIRKAADDLPRGFPEWPIALVTGRSYLASLGRNRIADLLDNGLPWGGSW